GMYSVMIGVLIDNKPAYGWVYQPTADVLYVAAPWQPVRKITADKSLELPHVCLSLPRSNIRLMMGNRDREKHNWVGTIPGVEFVYSGSVGLRVAMIIEGAADVYAHLSAKLKVWDTAAPAAMALSAGLEVGSFDFDGVQYVDSQTIHDYAIAFGRPGTLAWMRDNLRAARPAETPVIAAAPTSSFLPL
ncbi:MAG TPA: inositol monophosphatase family protein, partial [Candidatus Obscuribacterales bacterium]